MARLQLSLSILFALISTWTQGQQINTVEVGSTRYYVSDFSPYSPRYNWFLSFQYCNTIGMELLTMPRQEETLELLQFLKDSGKSLTDYWTSGNQLGSSMWTWMSSGQQLNSSFSYWDTNGPPLTKGSNSCMNLQNAKWSASDCMEEKSFICQLTRCYYFNYVVTTRQGDNPTPISQVRKSTFDDKRDHQNQHNLSDSVPISKSIQNSASGILNANHQSTLPAESDASSLRRVRPLSNSRINSQENRILDYNNEIESIGALSQELTPPQVISGALSNHPIVRPLINSDTIVQKLKRKETFSWALTDDSHNNPK